MEKVSFYQDVTYGDQKPVLKVLFENDNTKEVRIAFKDAQEMKAHKSSFPIVVQILEGKIDFGVETQTRFAMEKGDMIAVDANVVHDLIALEESLVRLSIHKTDPSKPAVRTFV